MGSRSRIDRSAVDTSYHLVDAPPDASPIPGVDAESFAVFWHKVMAEVRDRFDVRHNRDSDRVRAARSFIQCRVDELLRETSPPARTRLVDRAMISDNRSIVVSSVLLTAGGTGWVAFTIYVAKDWNNVIGGVSALAVLVTVFFIGLLPSMSPGVVTASGWRMAAWPVLRTARLLNQARPLHPLRWVALVSFIVGSLIDLISS